MDSKQNGNWLSHQFSLIDTTQYQPAGNPPKPLPLSPTVRKDVFLSALLEMPATERTRRSPLQWAEAMGLHFVIVALLLIIPLYVDGKLGEKSVFLT